MDTCFPAPRAGGNKSFFLFLQLMFYVELLLSPLNVYPLPQELDASNFYMHSCSHVLVHVQACTLFSG